MAYTKKIWKDYPDTTTQIKAEDLNNIENGIEAVDTVVNNGWIPLTGTFAYSSADSPTFVMSTSVDLTGIVGLGMRIKLTQTTTKYFIVTAITTSSITMYGGTDYTLVNASISNVYYSMLKAPYGFPTSKTKWTLSNQITSSTSKYAPDNNTWYNIGGSLTVPIGLWIPKYSALMAMVRSSTGSVNQSISISTTNNSNTNPEYTQKFSGYADIEADISVLLIGNPLLVESPTTYYLNCKKDSAATGQKYIYLLGDQQTTILQFECAYL